MRSRNLWLRQVALLALLPGGLLGCGGSGGRSGGGTFAGGGDGGTVLPPGGGGPPLPSDNADLARLYVTPGVVAPIFDANILAYTSQVTMLQESVSLSVAPADPNATLYVNGVETTSTFFSPPIPVAGGATPIVIQVHAQTGRVRTYVLSVTRGGLTTEEAYVKASNTGDRDGFGGKGSDTDNITDYGHGTVALSGDTLVVGAPYESSQYGGVEPGADAEKDDTMYAAGAVYVYVRSGTTWTQEAYIKAPYPDKNDYFGCAVAIDGDTLVVGASGEASDVTGVDSTTKDNNNAAKAGAAFVFVRSYGTWTQQAYLKASNTDAGDKFGTSVGVYEDTIVVGAVSEASSATGVNKGTTYEADNSRAGAGAAYVFVRSGSAWSQQAYMKASNTDAADHFGLSVAIGKDTVLVAAPWEKSKSNGVNPGATAEADNSGIAVGAVYVFARSGATWVQDAYVKSSNGKTGTDLFGWSVAISGDMFVAGAPFESSSATGVNAGSVAEADDSMPSAGAAYVFLRVDGTWAQRAYLKASNSGGDDRFGFSVDIDGNVVVVGALFEDGNATGINPGAAAEASNAAFNGGAAYVFLCSEFKWRAMDYVKASNTDATDSFGFGVAVAKDTVAVSAPGEASKGLGVNSGLGADNTLISGAAYVFR